MMRVAAYCRVSTDKEDQANSYEAQQRYFRDCIERNPDWVLQEIYADEGLSGTSTQKRKQFHTMIQAAKEGKIDLIITKEVSRFARNTLDTLEYTRILRRLGVGILFLIDNINTLDSDGELRLTIMASLAQEESRKTSCRVKWGQTQSMQKGVVFGGSLLGYDVVNGTMRINPEGAKAVRSIFYKYLNQRKGSGVIARELQEEGVVSSRGNLKWSASTVLKILKNEKYCGDLIQKKTYTPDFLSHEKKYNKGQEELVVLRDHHEPIIERTIWEEVQRELRRRSRQKKQSHCRGNRYPLSGKIKCADCGSSFLCRTKKNKSGETYRVWRCGRAVVKGAAHGCAVGHQLREDTALEMLQGSMKDVEIDKDALIENLSSLIEKVQNNCGDESWRIERELEAEEEKRSRALEYLVGGTISDEDFRFISCRCLRRSAELRNQLEVLHERQSAGEKAGGISEEVRKIVEEGSSEIWSRMAEGLWVYNDGRVEVALRGHSARWYYVVQKRSSVPMSVSSAFSSGYGME